jgi:hypothetical protein
MRDLCGQDCDSSARKPSQMLGKLSQRSLAHALSGLRLALSDSAGDTLHGLHGHLAHDGDRMSAYEHGIRADGSHSVNARFDMTILGLDVDGD